METIIIEFLLGVVAGTIFGLLIVKRTRTGIPQRKTQPDIKLAPQRYRTLPRQVKPRHVRSRRSRSKPARNQPVLTNTVARVSASSVAPEPVTSCPRCGLQAPENLMAEHFLGSPSHEYESQKDQSTLVDPKPQEGSPSIDLEQESKDSLRHLLQMLVPPRAFGRRHGQRTVDPISSIVRTMGPARNDSSQ